MVGIELDPVTAHVAAALYPHAQIRNESFADTELPEGSFDAAIGNVPFGKIHLQRSPAQPGAARTRSTPTSSASPLPGPARRPDRADHLPPHPGRDRPGRRRGPPPAGPASGNSPRRSGCRQQRTAALPAPMSSPMSWRSAGSRTASSPRPASQPGYSGPRGRRRHADPGEPVFRRQSRHGAGRAGRRRCPGGRRPPGDRGRRHRRRRRPGAGAGRGRRLPRSPAPRPATPSPVTGRPPEGHQQARPDGTFARMTGRSFASPSDPPGRPRRAGGAAGTAGPAERGDSTAGCRRYHRGRRAGRWPARPDLTPATTPTSPPTGRSTGTTCKSRSAAPPKGGHCASSSWPRARPGLPAASWRSATLRCGTGWSRPGTPPSPRRGSCGRADPRGPRRTAAAARLRAGHAPRTAPSP